MIGEYKFTEDWFHWAPPVWQQIIKLMPERKAFLELGSFEGRSAVWIVENMMEDGGVLTCVDTWEGGAEHKEGTLLGAKDRFFENIKLVREKHPLRKINPIEATTYLALKHIPAGKTFDFIYIDASHAAKDILTDACMAWPLLKKDGLMVFDDYLWGDARDVLHRPKIAIDAFTTIFAEEVGFVSCGYQLIVRKL
jgi:predicted O-methyltransferase YrrM